MAKKILIIEDEENLIELLKVNFETNFFEVAVAYDGVEGLSKSISENPDLIILDVRLPLMNGWEVCKYIKKNEKTKDIPVLILTAATQKNDFLKSKEVGCDLYLAKPFDPIELVKIIKNILNNIDKKGA